MALLPDCARIIVERSYLTTSDRVSLDAVRRVRDNLQAFIDAVEMRVPRREQPIMSQVVY